MRKSSLKYSYTFCRLLIIRYRIMSNNRTWVNPHKHFFCIRKKIFLDWFDENQTRYNQYSMNIFMILILFMLISWNKIAMKNQTNHSSDLFHFWFFSDKFSLFYMIHSECEALFHSQWDWSLKIFFNSCSDVFFIMIYYDRIHSQDFMIQIKIGLSCKLLRWNTLRCAPGMT